MRQITILAIDLGSKTGWAANKGPITSGVENFVPGRFEGGGMRFLKFRRWLSATISLVEPDEIVFEEMVLEITEEDNAVLLDDMASEAGKYERRQETYTKMLHDIAVENGDPLF